MSPGQCVTAEQRNMGVLRPITDVAGVGDLQAVEATAGQALVEDQSY